MDMHLTPSFGVSTLKMASYLKIVDQPFIMNSIKKQFSSMSVEWLVADLEERKK